MPTAGATHKNGPAKSKAETKLTARAVGRRKTSYDVEPTVQDRIRRWQDVNAAEAVDPDVLSVRSQARSQGCRTPARSPSPSARVKEAQSTPRRRSTKWVQQQDKAWVKQRRSVRADHRQWKERHAPDEEAAPRLKETEDSLMNASRTNSAHERNMASSRAERDERRKRRREARSRASGGVVEVEDGIRVYAASERNAASDFESPGEVEVSDIRNANAKGPSRPDYQSQLSFQHDGPLPDAEDDVDVHNVQPSKYAQTLGQPPVYEAKVELAKTRKRALLNKTKEVLTGRSEASVPKSNRIPSIEAWLDEQPGTSDPFIAEDDEPVITPLPSDVPKPLKSRPRRKKLSVEPTEATIVEVEDPNKIWDAVSSPQPARGRDSARNQPRQETETSIPQRRLFSFEVSDDLKKGDAATFQPPEYVPHGEDTAQNVRAPKTTKSRRRRKTREPEVVTSHESLAPIELNRHDSIQPDRDISPKKQSLAVIQENVPVPTEHGHIVEQTHSLEQVTSTQLKRKLTTHEDLLSVLSQPRARKSTLSLRTATKTEAAPDLALIYEAIGNMQEEEIKYARELKTLVDGVTPVLLQSLLSKTDAATTAGLFSDNKADDISFTRPIVDMGVALQRLKNVHQRIPLQNRNIEDLLAWAIVAQKSYADYVKAWRLGFQDVVVNLAPLDPSSNAEQDMLARDVDGDATNDEGEKVDVAYLQKRPLVRIKRLSKLFTTIRSAMPAHQKAIKVAESYADLTDRAKQRHAEEQGRLEDEAAAAIDTSRVRDIKTMAPLCKVEVDKKRRVRARDFFDLSLCHSTGQRLDCKVELVLRDDPGSDSNGGDVLICHVDEESKWLLFQPIQINRISSRRDKSQSDLVLMISGIAGIGTKWTELLAVKAEESAAAVEWLHMLGSNPLPAKLNHIPSWDIVPEPLVEEPRAVESPRIPLNAATLANLPSDVDVPIGEPSVISTRRQQQAAHITSKAPERQVKLSMGGGLQRRELPERFHHAPASNNRHSNEIRQSLMPSVVSSDAQSQSSRVSVASKPLPITPSQQGQQACANHGQAYSPQKFGSPNVLPSPQLPTADRSTHHSSANEKTSIGPEMTVLSAGMSSSSISAGRTRQENTIAADKPVATEKAISSPSSPRPPKHESTKSSIPLTETIREQWASLSALTKRRRGSTALAKDVIPDTAQYAEQGPLSQRSAKGDVNDGNVHNFEIDVPAPPVPKHKSMYAESPSQGHGVVHMAVQDKKEQVQVFDHIAHPVAEGSVSESSSESDSDETDATSEFSQDDFRSELKDEPTPLIAIGNGKIRNNARPLPSTPTTGTRTLDPSDSASNGPYRKAPPPSSFPAHKKKRTIAMVCSWSDRGIWEPIRDEECSIVVSPGLVQAFTITAAHSQPMAGADWEPQFEEDEIPLPIEAPLVEFELTPIVPLRKGTALDITIRSPPTPNSTVRTTSNVMFRSRTVQECEKLYQLINWARCNNPTYAQIARSRAREHSVSFAATVPETKSRSWFSFGSKQKGGYRATSKPPSIAESAASGGTTTSALSALRKFGIGSPFSLNRSSVIRKPGFHLPGASLYSSSNSGSGSGASTPVPPSSAGFVPGPDGPNVPATSAEAANGGGMVNNMKVRLFLRQGQKWEALGQCLLTVLPAAPPLRDSQPGTPTLSSSTPPRAYPPSAMPQPRSQHFRLPSSGNTPHKIHGDGREKRILVTAAKRKELVLLDEVLGESCFEKVMQTGIAVNVWKEDDAINQYGGVMTGRSRTYMIQFRTSMEASWVFNMCGTYRYGRT